MDKNKQKILNSSQRLKGKTMIPNIFYHHPFYTDKKRWERLETLIRTMNWEPKRSIIDGKSYIINRNSSDKTMTQWGELFVCGRKAASRHLHEFRDYGFCKLNKIGKNRLLVSLPWYDLSTEELSEYMEKHLKMSIGEMISTDSLLDHAFSYHAITSEPLLDKPVNSSADLLKDQTINLVQSRQSKKEIITANRSSSLTQALLNCMSTDLQPVIKGFYVDEMKKADSSGDNYNNKFFYNLVIELLRRDSTSRTFVYSHCLALGTQISFDSFVQMMDDIDCVVALSTYAAESFLVEVEKKLKQNREHLTNKSNSLLYVLASFIKQRSKQMAAHHR